MAPRCQSLHALLATAARTGANAGKLKERRQGGLSWQSAKPTALLLADHQIRDLCKQGMVVPYNEELLNPASLDVTLGSTILVEVEHTPELQILEINQYSQADPFWVAPGEFFLAETVEMFFMPANVGAQFVLKSSRAREGWDHAEAGWCDPSWTGSRLTMELKNGRRYHSLAIWPGMKIGQMKFVLVDQLPEVGYDKKGNYNGDSGVTASRGHL